MDVVSYLKFQGIDSEERSNGEIWFCCPFHDGDNTPSCSINKHTEKWNCFGCKAGGTTVNSFITKLDKTLNKAIFKHKTVDEALILAAHKKLMLQPDVLRRLWNERKINAEVLIKYKIGWDGQKIWIPIYKDDKLLNVKLWDAFKLNSVKMMWWGKKIDGYTTNGLIFPDNISLLNDPIYTEGEGDCLAALSAGFPVFTGGGTTFDFAYILPRILGKRITLCYDNDPPGHAAEKLAVKRLLDSKITTRIADLSILGATEGQDLTDCFLNIPDFISNFGAYLNNLQDNSDDIKVIKLNLSEGISSEHYGKNILFQAHIVSICTTPKHIAKKIMVMLDENEKKYYDFDIKKYPEIAISLYKSNSLTEKNILAGLFKIKNGATIVIVETYNLVEMFLQQEVQLSDEIKESVNFQVAAYTTDYTISPYKTYEFTARSIRRPDTLEDCFFILESETKKMQDAPLTKDDLGWLNLFVVRGDKNG